MADFVAAFEIDDSTILFRLHEAALDLAKKTGIGSTLRLVNTGIVDRDPKKSFNKEDSQYQLFASVKKNLQIFDGAAKFLSDNGFMEESKLKKEIGDAAWNKSDSGHVSQLKKLKKDIFEVLQAYFKTFASQEKSSKISEDDLVLVIEESKLPFGKNGEALDEEAMIGFKLGYTIGLGATS